MKPQKGAQITTEAGSKKGLAVALAGQKWKTEAAIIYDDVGWFVSGFLSNTLPAIIFFLFPSETQSTGFGGV